MKRGPLLVAICSCLAVAAIACWPVIRLSRALDSGETAARSSFTELRRSAINLVPAPSAASGDEWRRKAASAWREQKNLLAVVIKDSGGEVVYAKPGASPYYRRGPEGLSFERPEGTTMSFKESLASGMVIEALYVTLSQEEAFYPVRDAAIVFAALLALLVAALLVVSNSNPREDGSAGASEAGAPAQGAAPPDTGWEPEMPTLAIEESSLYSEEPFRDDRSPDAPAARPEPPSTGLAGSGSQADIPTEDGGVAVRASGQELKATFIRSADLPAGALEGPRGLFDPESGLGWEAYLRERLSAELRRSASFEQDLSLLITSLDGAKRGDEEFNLFASSVRDYFSFKDMAFLFGDDGAALILPNIDVDHALRMSEELNKKLSLLFRSRLAGGSSGIFMGLSSRAGRLVDADRIIGESMAALVKAKQAGEVKIMAFRPDPEKFRAYLAGQ